LSGTSILIIVVVELVCNNSGMSDTKLIQAVLDKVTKIDEKVDKGFKDVDKRFDQVDKRIDKLGLDLAELADDAPTVEEFDDLEKRVVKVEEQITSV
jgi:predicted RND superfamily exporter protein